MTGGRCRCARGAAAVGQSRRRDRARCTRSPVRAPARHHPAAVGPDVLRERALRARSARSLRREVARLVRAIAVSGLVLALPSSHSGYVYQPAGRRPVPAARRPPGRAAAPGPRARLRELDAPARPYRRSPRRGARGRRGRRRAPRLGPRVAGFITDGSWRDPASFPTGCWARAGRSSPGERPSSTRCSSSRPRATSTS